MKSNLNVYMTNRYTCKEVYLATFTGHLDHGQQSSTSDSDRSRY